MNPFDVLLASHVLMATLSVCLLVFRCSRRLIQHPLPDPRWLRITPHVVDTLLLLTGISLAWILGLDPRVVSWLGVKLLLIVVYIVLGLLAFRLPGPRGLRIGAFILALLVFADIVAVAITRSPWGFWA